MPSSDESATTVQQTTGGTGSPPLVLPPAGYELGEVIGKGGMGEVVAAGDRRIGRPVALKRMRDAAPAPEEVARFLREAQIQARLDHPAIAPVYELGIDTAGRPYFTMKRLAGTTLRELIGEAELARLLRAFVEVCLAIELAHTRGVVHRDLKPANVMLGDFGEVYVLDWGIARVLDHSEMRTRGDIPTLPGQTAAGAVLGTPGYMPPEQARGEPVGPAGDIYALGCILFEILAREPLHPRDGALASTLAPHDGSPARRAPARAIAPELDAACVAALAARPDDRPSARGLAERVQRYLDGDRDLDRRRALAADELERAQRVLAAGDRAGAMQAAGRALALDPTSRAAALVGRLMLEPPDRPPPELALRIAEVDHAYMRSQWRQVGFAWLSMLATLPMVAALGVRVPAFVAVFYLVCGLLAALSFANVRAARPWTKLVAVLNIVLIVLCTRVTGPFIIMPVILCITVASWVSYPPLIDRPIVPALLGAVAFGVPLLIEALGLVSPTWRVAHGEVVAMSSIVELGGTPTRVFLIVGTIAGIAAGGWLARAIAASRRDLQRTVETQAWHLRKLLP